MKTLHSFESDSYFYIYLINGENKVLKKKQNEFLRGPEVNFLQERKV